MDIVCNIADNVAGNIASNNADSAWLPAILLISNVALLAIFSAILLILQYCWKFYQQYYWIFSNIASNIKPGPTSFPYLQLPGVQLSTTSLVQPVFTVYSSQNLVLAKAAPATTVQTPQTLCTAVQLSSCMISPNLLMYSTVDNAENFTSCLTGAAPLNINALVGESSTWSLPRNVKQNVYWK